MTHLYVSSPTHYAPEADFVRSLIALTHKLRDLGISQTIELPDGESHIDRARNNVVARFLQSPATHLMFIDSDQAFTPQDVLHLVESGKDLIGALIPKKQINWEGIRQAAKDGHEDIEAYGAQYVVNPPKDGRTLRIDKQCVPVDAIGTGFMLVSREAIESVIKAHPETEYLSDDVAGEMQKSWAIFHAGVYDEGWMRFLTEDYVFCRRARAIGIQPHIHLGVRDIGHVGKHMYRGRIETTFTLSASEAA
jgi:hypothetical protein